MDRLDFIVPVRLVPEPGEPVTEIYSIDEALTFLQNCPEDRHGRVHQMALDYCLDAKVNLHTTEDEGGRLLDLPDHGYRGPPIRQKQCGWALTVRC